jgi:hypothetical protein
MGDLAQTIRDVTSLWVVSGTPVFQLAFSRDIEADLLIMRHLEFLFKSE